MAKKYVKKLIPIEAVQYTGDNFDELQEFHILNSDEKIPKFEDFLRLVQGKVPLIVELKIELKDLTVCRKAQELLDKAWALKEAAHD